MQFLKVIFSFINDHLLKMKWLEDLVNKILIDLFNLNPESMLFNATSFFIYDVIKIFILLSFLIFVASYIQSYFTPEKTKKILSNYKGVGANSLGALLGTLTPFCSCSSIPIFIGFTKAGLPIGVTFSFLISSPLVDIASIILLASIFNVKIAILYVLVGLVIAILGGTLISILKLEDDVLEFVRKNPNDQATRLEFVEYKMTRKDRVTYSFTQVKDIIKRVWLFIIIGVGIGSVIHGYVPESIITNILGSNNAFSVLIATVLGIPMYADIFGALPIAEALVNKGVGIGTVLAFMMSVTVFSLPSIIMIKKVVKTRLLVVFVTIVTVGIIIMGYVFNEFSHLLI